jgi:hypothetical protein
MRSFNLYSPLLASLLFLFSPAFIPDASPAEHPKKGLENHADAAEPFFASGPIPHLHIEITGTNLTGAALNLPAGVTTSAAPVVTATQITATLVVAATAAAGPQNITATTAGGTSAAVVFTVIPPPPSVESLIPRFVIVGSGAFPLFVSGLNFDTGAAVLVDGTPIATTFTSARSLRATVPVSFAATLGSRQVVVRNSDGRPSNVVSFEVIEPATVLSSISPVTAVAGGPSVALISMASTLRAARSLSSIKRSW